MQQPGGIPQAWFVGGTASVGSIVLLVLIAIKVSWWFCLLCIAASGAGQILLYPILEAPLRSVVGTLAERDCFAWHSGVTVTKQLLRRIGERWPLGHVAI